MNSRQGLLVDQPRLYRTGQRAPKAHFTCTPGTSLERLHAVAATAGIKRCHFDGGGRIPHYDVTPTQRAALLALGVVPVLSRQIIMAWRS